jgi:hypothetical protein
LTEVVYPPAHDMTGEDLDEWIATFPIKRD